MSLSSVPATMSLWAIAKQYKKGILKKPIWQRNSIWEEEKISSWCDFIDSAFESKQSAYLVGCITTCRLESENKEHEWINDGMHRIHATDTYIERKKLSGLSADDIETRLENVCITIHKTICLDQNEALKDHEKLNEGTLCTVYEKSNAYISVNLDDYTVKWEPIFQHIDHTVDVSMAILGILPLYAPSAGKNRVTIHKQLRDNRALLYRWLTLDKSTINLHSSSSQVSFHRPSEDKPFEPALVEIFKNKGSAASFKEVERFAQYLQREIANIKELRPDDKKRPNTGVIKAILHLSIYRLANDIPRNNFNSFVEDLFKRSYNGTSTNISPSDEDREQGLKQSSLGLGDLSWLNKVSQILHNNSMIVWPTRDKGEKLLPGLHNSHVKPFAENGNGETLPELAISNLSRGKKTMAPAEVTLLKESSNITNELAKGCVIASISQD